MKTHGKSKQEAGSAWSEKTRTTLRMFLVPCSCGRTFAVAHDYDHRGAAWIRYLICPACGKRHDPRNRLLQMEFHPEGYWKVDAC